MDFNNFNKKGLTDEQLNQLNQLEGVNLPTEQPIQEPVDNTDAFMDDTGATEIGGTNPVEQTPEAQASGLELAQMQQINTIEQKQVEEMQTAQKTELLRDEVNKQNDRKAIEIEAANKEYNDIYEKTITDIAEREKAYAEEDYDSFWEENKTGNSIMAAGAYFAGGINKALNGGENTGSKMLNNFLKSDYKKFNDRKNQEWKLIQSSKMSLKEKAQHRDRIIKEKKARPGAANLQAQRMLEKQQRKVQSQGAKHALQVEIDGLRVSQAQGKQKQQDDLTKALKKVQAEQKPVLSEAQRTFYKNKGISDEELDMVDSGLSGRNSMGALNTILERNEIATTSANTIATIDDSVHQLDNMLLTLKPEYVGIFDSMVHEKLISNEQVGFRSRVGKFGDAYRKAITGTAASPEEIKRLMANLPTVSDTHGAFKQKANEAIADLKARKKIQLDALEMSGRDIDKFKTKQAPKKKRRTAEDEKLLKELLDAKRGK